MQTNPTLYIQSTSTKLRAVPADLLDVELKGMSPRHQRLAVAGWCLAESLTGPAFKAAMRRAERLYELLGYDLLERPGRLTVAGIVGEVETLVQG